MNQVSIILNGVRYDSVVADLRHECVNCDLKDICDKMIEKSFNEVCVALTDEGYNFKKSDKKFEK